MRNLYRSISTLGVLAILFASFAQPALARTPDRSSSDEITRDTLFVPGEVVVGFVPDSTGSKGYATRAFSLAASLNAKVVDQSSSGTALFSFAEDADVRGLASVLKGKAGVQFAEPNYISWIPESNPKGNAHALTNVVRTRANGQRTTISRADLSAMRTVRAGSAKGVPTYPVDSNWNDWGWWASGANIIWSNTTVSPMVCEVDSGIDINHPDLKGHALNGYDFVNDDAIANDDNGHGTHVAGTIAAIANNKIGVAGISNGTVLAVKVLSSQGWGTSFDIAAGITYCANNAGVKVINMSLGDDTASTAEFLALSYAINTKGKLVVAAAGNDGTSAYTFPAAWAATYVCSNGTDTFPTDCISNTIAQGILSVGSARPDWFNSDSPYSFDGKNGGITDSQVWVDVNGDGLETSNEEFPTYGCASYFSNYGDWVQMIAPGEDIYSTQPVSYPFYNGYFYGIHSGYDTYSGTSQATPHVAAAATRTWSLHPTYTPAQIKAKLRGSGSQYFALASDPNVADVTKGYVGAANDGVNGYQGEAPFCWPDATAPFTAREDMTNSVYVDVAADMDRTAASAYVVDAVTGLPLNGATVYAYQGAALKDKAIVGMNCRCVDLINLPAAVPDLIKVSKAGYVSGTQQVGVVTPSSAGNYYWSDDSVSLGIPPMGRITAVANWADNSIDLDLFTFLPAVSTIGGVVGSGASGHTDDIGEGDLSGFPYARWNRDGGYGDFMGLESISIAPRPGFPNNPYYNVMPGDFYYFELSDFGSGDLNNANTLTFRIWRGGMPVATVIKTATCDSDGSDNTPGNADDESWWTAGYINGSVFTPINTCGMGATGAGGAWPYLTSHGTSSIPGTPGHK